MVAKHVLELKSLALLGAAQEPVRVSSSALAKEWRTSPQTVSRRLQAMERQDLIRRTMVPGGQKVALTIQGLDLLRREFAEYRRLFASAAPVVSLVGRVMTGLGEGQYYISQEGYLRQFRSRLGFEPFEGTLNLKLDGDGEAGRHRLDEAPGIPIEGFRTPERTFGPARCHRAAIVSVRGKRASYADCAAIIPARTHYPPNVLELLAPEGLRRLFKLKDGDPVGVEVSP